MSKRSMLQVSRDEFAAIIERQVAADAKAPPCAAKPKPKPIAKVAKYRNRPTNGYASMKEAKRAQELRLMEQAGKIRGLREQVSFELIPKQYRDGKLIERECRYVCDFDYLDAEARIVEDVKSPASRTAEYIIKRKLLLHVHGIRIREM